jgi:plastocyanin
MRQRTWLVIRFAVVAVALLVLAKKPWAGAVTVQVLDKEGKPTADAVVVLMPASGTVLPKTPLPVQATVVQEKMQFIPAVTLVPLGARVKFVNNDPWDHHVRMSAARVTQFASGATGGFEFRLEGRSEGKPPHASELLLDRPGAIGASLLGCFLHGSMRGNIYVSESPWAAKTGTDGTATFNEVPDGAALVKVWQADQLLDLPVQPIMVGAVPLQLKTLLPTQPRRLRAVPVSTYTGS